MIFMPEDRSVKTQLQSSEADREWEALLNSTVIAQQSPLALYGGSLLLSGIVAGMLSMSLSEAIWGLSEAVSRGNVFWLFALIFFPLLGALLYAFATMKFKIEDGTVSKAGKPMFLTRDIESVHIGMPDTLASRAYSSPLMKLLPGGRNANATMQQRKEVLMVKLKNDRWFMWMGLHFDGGLEFRTRLTELAPITTIDEFPNFVLRRLSPIYCNRLLVEKK